jgi:hypothetical protein
MKPSLAIGLSVVLAACTSGKGQWLGADPSSGPTQIAGSADHTTNAFDGEYRDLSVTNNSKTPIMGPGGGSGNIFCASYSGNQFPPLTVKNGLAQFEALGVHFAGYVTPQGHLKMSSGYGATVSGNVKEVPVDEDFDGDFDSTTHRLRGQVLGNCAYKVEWYKVT